PRGALYIGRTEDRAAIDAFIARFAPSGVAIERLARGDMERMVSGLRPEWTEAAWEPACADIDVAGLHAHYLKIVRDAGAELRCSARLLSATREARGWRLDL